MTRAVASVPRATSWPPITDVRRVGESPQHSPLPHQTSTPLCQGDAQHVRSLFTDVHAEWLLPFRAAASMADQ